MYAEGEQGQDAAKPEAEAEGDDVQDVDYEENNYFISQRHHVSLCFI
jgi:hypothetical protein